MILYKVRTHTRYRGCTAAHPTLWPAESPASSSSPALLPALTRWALHLILFFSVSLVISVSCAGDPREQVPGAGADPLTQQALP